MVLRNQLKSHPRTRHKLNIRFDIHKCDLRMCRLALFGICFVVGLLGVS